MKISTTVLLLTAFSAPAFAAELPQSATLHYSGNLKIPATMNFSRSGDSYKIVSTVKVPLYRIRFESGGTLSGNTLKPSYYREIRDGKVYAEAKFQGGSVRYGKRGNTNSKTVNGTTMDLFTLAWQLAANDGELPERLHVTNGKKIYPVSGFSKTGSATYKLSGGSTPIDRYVVRRDDETIQYSFATALNNVPAQITYKDDDGKSYNLRLTKLVVNGETVKP